MAITRGNTVFFDIKFRDQNKAVVAVTSATLKLKFKQDGCDKDATVTLTAGAETNWTGSWESEVSDTGHVNYSAKGVNSEGTSVVDGKFRLDANKANERVNG